MTGRQQVDRVLELQTIYAPRASVEPGSIILVGRVVEGPIPEIGREVQFPLTPELIDGLHDLSIQRRVEARYGKSKIND